MGSLIDIVSVAGASPNWSLTVVSSAGAQVGDHLTAPLVDPPAGRGGLYRITAIPDGTHIDVADDLDPDGGVYGEPGAGSGQFFTPTSSYGLSQNVDSGPYWGVPARRDNVLLDREIAESQELYTLDTINIVIDPVAGTSPPSDTVISSQADYDALGYDLLYIQDVYDILPQFMNKPVLVTLKAGTYVHKPGSSGIPGFEMILAVGQGRTLGRDASPLDNDSSLGNGAILFEGESDTVLDSEQSGTSSTLSITRDAGTWTDHEHRGAFAYIKTGPNAGSRYLIHDNDTTTLYVTADISSTGAITFEIVEPAAVVDDSTFYTGYLKVGSLATLFEWVKFGLSTDYLGTLFVGGYIVARYCQLRLSEISSFSSRIVSYISFLSCYLSTELTMRGREVEGGLSNCVMEGNATITSSLAVPIFNGTLTISHTYFYAEEGSGYSGRFIYPYNNGKIFIDGGPLFLSGNNTAYGILLPEDGSLIYDDATIEANDCVVAIEGRVSRFYIGAMSGSGNDTGIKLSGGSQLIVNGDPSSLGAATEIDLDGIAADYSELGASGDKITGPEGSSILRR